MSCFDFIRNRYEGKDLNQELRLVLANMDYGDVGKLFYNCDESWGRNLISDLYVAMSDGQDVSSVENFLPSSRDKRDIQRNILSDRISRQYTIKKIGELSKFKTGSVLQSVRALLDMPYFQDEVRKRTSEYLNGYFDGEKIGRSIKGVSSTLDLALFAPYLDKDIVSNWFLNIEENLKKRQLEIDFHIEISNSPLWSEFIFELVCCGKLDVNNKTVLAHIDKYKFRDVLSASSGYGVADSEAVLGEIIGLYDTRKTESKAKSLGLNQDAKKLVRYSGVDKAYLSVSKYYIAQKARELIANKNDAGLLLLLKATEDYFCPISNIMSYRYNIIEEQDAENDSYEAYILKAEINEEIKSIEFRQNSVASLVYLDVEHFPETAKILPESIAKSYGWDVGLGDFKQRARARVMDRSGGYPSSDNVVTVGGISMVVDVLLETKNTKALSDLIEASIIRSTRRKDDIFRVVVKSLLIDKNDENEEVVQLLKKYETDIDPNMLFSTFQASLSVDNSYTDSLRGRLGIQSVRQNKMRL